MAKRQKRSTFFFFSRKKQKSNNVCSSEGLFSNESAVLLCRVKCWSVQFLFFFFGGGKTC